MNNIKKLQDLIEEILLLDDDVFSRELKRDDVSSWDSMATVAIAIGIEEEFNHHPSPEEAGELNSVEDIVKFLQSKGLSFD